MSEHTQVGPYALGLLDPIEMSRFEEHLADCDECGAQLEWMLPVADMMADVEPGDLFDINGPSAFSAPGGSGQQYTPMSEPAARSTQQAQPPGHPLAYAPLSELSTPQYPEEFSPTNGPRTGEVPDLDPRTGSIPTVDPRTGSIPTVNPRTGSIPRVDPYTGSIPRVDPLTGENRIVPLVRGGESRRRTQSQAPVSRRPAEADYPARRRPVLLIAAAAAMLGAVAGAGAVVSGPWADQGTTIGPDTGETRLPPTEQIAATDAETGVHAAVGLESKLWGTQVFFAVTAVDGPRECQLVAVLSNGDKEVLSTWLVPEQGYSASTTPPKLEAMAATSVNARDITSFLVQDINENGEAKTLVTVRAT